MQDVTDLSFMRLCGHFGVPDYFFTEYFRVHEHSTLDRPILESILHHNTGRPVFAQLIGEDLNHLRRSALQLQDYPIAGVDLNMGCPAPKIYRKNVGGGLLRDPSTIDRILGTLREVCDGRFTVKMRIGFEDDRHFTSVLDLLDKHQVDALSLHGRTVRQMYRGAVDYPRIRSAVQRLNCPVFANGNISSATVAMQVAQFTGAYGVMIGRAAIRNPWIFRQIREHSCGSAPFQPRLADVRCYIQSLWDIVPDPVPAERNRLNRMKKFLNFIGQSVDPEGKFLHEMRRATTTEQFFAVCDRFLIDNGRQNVPFADEPYAGLIARPNAEDAPENATCDLFARSK